MSDLNSWPPRTGFDIGTTSFNTLKAVRELMISGTKDDVQPMSIIAAEQLGSNIMICAERHNEAVNALNGNDSVRLESVRSTIGLCSGDTRKHVRESTRLLAVFALCTALKLCYLDEEIGSLLFLLMDTSKVLRSYATSSNQLCSFVKQIAGHCESIVPMDLMHEMAVKIAQYEPGPKLYHRLQDRVLANLLFHFFESYQDEEIKEISLAGHEHGVWLASTILWLLGEQNVHVVVDNKHQIRGDVNARVCVNVVTESAGPWIRTTWKIGQDLKNYTYRSDQDEDRSPQRLPAILLKSYFENYFWTSSIDAEKRLNAVETTAIIAEALILLVYEVGRVGLSKPCSRVWDEISSTCCSTKLSNLVGNNFLSAGGIALATYGWKSDQSVHHEALELLKLLTAELRGLSGAKVEQTILGHCQALIKRRLITGAEGSWVIDQAIFIATDAAVTSTCQIINGQRYCKLLHDTDLDKTKYIFFSLVGTGLSFHTFREAAFSYVLPGFEDHDSNNLVVCQDGYVAGLAVLWNMSTKQQDALAIQVQKGGIRQNDFVYERIIETPGMPSILSHERSSLVFSDHGTAEVPRLVLEMPGGLARPELLTSISVSGKTLAVKHSMVLMDTISKTTTKHRVSWINSADALAVATHVSAGNNIVPMVEQTLLRRLQQACLTSPIVCVSLFQVPSDTGTIITTKKGATERFFAAGNCNNEAILPKCAKLFVRQEASLIQCIDRAVSYGSGWIIIE